MEYKKWEPAPKTELLEELTDCVGIVMAFLDVEIESDIPKEETNEQ